MTAKLNKPIKNFLRDFGLNDKEIDLYLTLLKTGPSTIMDLSRESGIKRSTTHNNVEELVKKGLVSQTNYGERRMVVAEDPEKLKFLMEQKKWNVKKLEENLPDVVKMISESVPQSDKNEEVAIKYYDGVHGVFLIYEDALSAKELRTYANLEKVVSIFPNNDELFLEAQHKNKDLKMWEIVDESDLTKKFAKDFAQNERYKFKFSSNAIKLTSVDTLIYDGKVAVVDLKQPVSGFVIANQEYYEMAREIFDFVWRMLPAVKN